ncbi:Uncharacterised protein [Mycobacteroides abscessus subsp. abscessus]|nr:Uncharacterised protein [Mycobacteroides abscessus subsp. abscessus]
MPEDCGSTSPSTAWAATRASAADPPSRNTLHAACVAKGFAVAAA